MPGSGGASSGTPGSGWLFELLVAAAALWIGFRLDLVPGGQVGIDVLLAGAGWWFGGQISRRRGAVRSVLADGFGALWLPVLAAIGLTIGWVLRTDSVVKDRIVRGEALGLVGGYGNWHQIAWGPSEVEGPRLLTSLVHAWPVSVAVQASLLWALIAWASGAWARGGSGRRDPVVAVGLVVAGVAWVAGLLAVSQGLSSQSLLLATPTRGVSFVLGAVLGAAGTTGRSTRVEQSARLLVIVPIVVLVALAVLAPPGSALWRTGGSAASTLLAVIAVAAAVADRDTRAVGFQANPIAWYALVAFVVVHGSVLALLDTDAGGPAGVVLGFGAVVVALAVAGELGLLAATRSHTPASIERRRVIAPVIGLALVVGLLSATGAFAWESPRSTHASRPVGGWVGPTRPAPTLLPAFRRVP